MKFSSALISATLLATAVFAAPEPQAPASASASEMSVASMSAVSEFASASASAMDIVQLLQKRADDDEDDKEWGHDDEKEWDHDDHHDDHHDDKSKNDIYVVLDQSSAESAVCRIVNQKYKETNTFGQGGLNDPLKGLSSGFFFYGDLVEETAKLLSGIESVTPIAGRPFTQVLNNAISSTGTRTPAQESQDNLIVDFLRVLSNIIKRCEKSYHHKHISH
ncbi:hypothetical protein BD560DRAFT_427161 [Blakeslea trispora]|nr:hypothetical protein BD560DRAFT_427161 [Blakeslea trispora]